MSRPLRFTLIVLASLGLLVLATSFFVSRTIGEWVDRDLSTRAQLAVRGAHSALVTSWITGSSERLNALLTDLTRDERLVASAACTRDGARVAASAEWPVQISCADIAPNVRPAADAKGVRLHVTLDPLAGPVKGDPGRLQQVVWNLLSNAIKFTPKGGRVQVFLERVNSHIEVTVADNGNGIRPEFLPHVFDRFRQADSSTSRRHGGLGLGLSIVKQLVELHGGMVRAKSPGEGLGATFVVDLPLMPLHELPGDGEKPRAHPAAQGPLAEVLRDAQDLTAVTVLVVDDEPDARELVRRLLEDCGATVHTAGSADEAVAALRSRAVSVMVSDIGMPAVDGYELIRRVRALPEKDRAAVPAAAVTAFARPEDRMRAMLAGYDLHLAKPIEPVELVVAVAALARRGAAGRASP